MNTNPHQDALRSRWTLEGTIPLSGVADGAAWHRARSVATGDAVTLFIVRGETALETADAVRRAYLVEDPHLMPVREVVVLDDPRESAAGSDPGAQERADAHPTTVVEYPLPPAPPLAALLGKGPMHPETARAVIGEAATGLEVARRRGLRHQFLDSNRIFVDTHSGEVKVLGVGVEAASHPDLDRSREVASFQDTAALTALLYRALSGSSPRPDENGTVPKPSVLMPEGSAPIPADLDLLCELVLNESAEEIPETTRGLIAALEPWQSIPVTLEAYRQYNAPLASSASTSASPSADAPAAAPVGSAPAASTDSPAAAPGSGLDEDSLESTALMGAVPDEEDAAGQDVEDTDSRAHPHRDPDPSSGQGIAASAAAAGMVGAAGAVGAAGIHETASSRTRADERSPGASQPGHSPAGQGPAEQEPMEQEPKEQASPAAPDTADPQPADQQETARTASAAQAIVRDLRLDEKRSQSAFPGDLEITVPRRPQPPGPGSVGQAPAPAHPEGEGRLYGYSHPDEPTAAGGTGVAAAAGTAAIAGGVGGIAVSGGAVASAPGAAETVGGSAGPAPAAAAADSSIPARRSGSHWPLAPDHAGDSPQQPADSSGSASTPAAAPAPSSPADPESSADSPAPVAVAGRTEPVTAGLETGPIVVRGREHSAFDDPPTEVTQPAQRSTLLREVVNVAVDSDDPGTFAMGPSQPEQRSRQAQWILLGGVLLVILALVFALSSITSGLRERVENPLDTDPAPSAVATQEEPTEDEPAEEEPTEDEEEELPPAELGGVELFVEGSDSEPDNADQTDRITDDDPGTFWSTQHYTSPQYGGLKDGVGVRIDLAEESTLSSVVVTTARNSGGVLELRAVGEDGSLGDTLATGEFAGDGEVRLELDEPVETDSVALWLSELPPDSNESGRFRARIAEIQVE